MLIHFKISDRVLSQLVYRIIYGALCCNFYGVIYKKAPAVDLTGAYKITFTRLVAIE